MAKMVRRNFNIALICLCLHQIRGYIAGKSFTRKTTRQRATYPVIKTALVGLTRYLATYWNDAGIRVNALSPGGVFNGHNDEFACRLAIFLWVEWQKSRYQSAVVPMF